MDLDELCRCQLYARIAQGSHVDPRLMHHAELLDCLIGLAATVTVVHPAYSTTPTAVEQEREADAGNPLSAAVRIERCTGVLLQNRVGQDFARHTLVDRCPLLFVGVDLQAGILFDNVPYISDRSEADGVGTQAQRW
ncbi:MAG: hypothetical protein MMC33_002162 [Icmadophila ericetorum]|nr:hypothetical protein [Icmadophila ericetorum]